MRLVVSSQLTLASLCARRRSQLAPRGAHLERGAASGAPRRAARSGPRAEDRSASRGCVSRRGGVEERGTRSRSNRAGGARAGTGHASSPGLRGRCRLERRELSPELPEWAPSRVRQSVVHRRRGPSTPTEPSAPFRRPKTGRERPAHSRSLQGHSPSPRPDASFVILAGQRRPSNPREPSSAMSTRAPRLPGPRRPRGRWRLQLGALRTAPADDPVGALSPRAPPLTASPTRPERTRSLPRIWCRMVTPSLLQAHSLPHSLTHVNTGTETAAWLVRNREAQLVRPGVGRLRTQPLLSSQPHRGGGGRRCGWTCDGRAARDPRTWTGPRDRPADRAAERAQLGRSAPRARPRGVLTRPRPEP